MVNDGTLTFIVIEKCNCLIGGYIYRYTSLILYCSILILINNRKPVYRPFVVLFRHEPTEFQFFFIVIIIRYLFRYGVKQIPFKTITKLRDVYVFNKTESLVVIRNYVHVIFYKSTIEWKICLLFLQTIFIFT